MREAKADAGAAVIARAGHAYPEEPVAFNWGGERREVLWLVREWRQPGAKLYLVVDDRGARFRLTYFEWAGEWRVERS